MALLLAVPAVAQSSFEDSATDADSVHAPVQLLLDQWPTLMQLAIDEATLDGSPDDATELARQMRAFFAHFQGQPEWPNNAVASTTNARAIFDRVDAILDVAHRTPDAVASLARVDARCIESRGVATLDSARAWWNAGAASAGDIDFFARDMQALADSLPAPLEVGPVHLGLNALVSWLHATAITLEECVETLLIVLGEKAEAYALGPLLGGNDSSADRAKLRFSVVPSTVHYDQTVRISGVVKGAPGSNPILDSSLGWNGAFETRLGGFFEGTYTVPLNAQVGPHTVTVRAGSLSDQALITVIKAPTYLQVQAPSQVQPNETISVHARATSPFLLPENAVLLINNDVGPATGFSISTKAPATEANLTFTIQYAGDVHHESATQTVTVRVRNPELVAPDAESIWDILDKEQWYGPTEDPGGAGGFGFQAAPRETGGLLVLAAALLLFAIGDAALSARRTPATFDEPTPVPGRMAWPRGFLRAFAAFAAFLIRIRAIRGGATARDVGRYLSERGIQSDAVVKDFEEVRYANASMEDLDQTTHSRWLWRFWRKAGGQ